MEMELKNRVVSQSPKNMVTVTEEKERENSKSTIQQDGEVDQKVTVENVDVK